MLLSTAKTYAVITCAHGTVNSFLACPYDLSYILWSTNVGVGSNPTSDTKCKSLFRLPVGVITTTVN